MSEQTAKISSSGNFQVGKTSCSIQDSNSAYITLMVSAVCPSWL